MQPIWWLKQTVSYSKILILLCAFHIAAHTLQSVKQIWIKRFIDLSLFITVKDKLIIKIIINLIIS